VTEVFLEALHIWAESIRNQWEEGQFSETGQLYTDALANAQALGQLKLLRKIVELDHEQFSEILSGE
jgi:hypothetical protein